jgi:hypothetical protein
MLPYQTRSGRRLAEAGKANPTVGGNTTGLADGGTPASITIRSPNCAPVTSQTSWPDRRTALLRP